MPTDPTPRFSASATAALTVLALAAFAGNSILCRLALLNEAIDPLSFTALRIGSGGLLLLPLALRRREGARSPWSARGALALLVYALAFSLAYVTLDTGTGALLLFGAVQLTMLGAAMLRGERLGLQRCIGVTLAIGGLVALLLPGATAPNLHGTILMLAAGVAWGTYSLLGRSSQDVGPSQTTAANFVLAAPIALALPIFDLDSALWTTHGVLLALLSGTLTSGLGYIVWYAVLPNHTATSAAAVQLTVPVLAALGGIMFLAEPWTSRLFICGITILIGVAMTFIRFQSKRSRRPS